MSLRHPRRQEKRRDKVSAVHCEPCAAYKPYIPFLVSSSCPRDVYSFSEMLSTLLSAWQMPCTSPCLHALRPGSNGSRYNFPVTHEAIRTGRFPPSRNRKACIIPKHDKLSLTTSIVSCLPYKRAGLHTFSFNIPSASRMVMIIIGIGCLSEPGTFSYCGRHYGTCHAWTGNKVAILLLKLCYAKADIVALHLCLCQCIQGINEVCSQGCRPSIPALLHSNLCCSPAAMQVGFGIMNCTNAPPLDDKTGHGSALTLVPPSRRVYLMKPHDVGSP